MIRLGVNIDHVATLRQVQGGREPDPRQLNCAAEAGAGRAELHPGRLAAATGREQTRELERVRQAVAQARDAGLRVILGHGVDDRNARIAGISRAVTEMKEQSMLAERNR